MSTPQKTEEKRINKSDKNYIKVERQEQSNMGNLTQILL